MPSQKELFGRPLERLPVLAGVYPAVMRRGEMEVGAYSCGRVAGLNCDIPTCQEPIDGIIIPQDACIVPGPHRQGRRAMPAWHQADQPQGRVEPC